MCSRVVILCHVSLNLNKYGVGVDSGWRGFGENSESNRDVYFGGLFLDEHSVLRLTSGIPPSISPTTWTMKSGTTPRGATFLTGWDPSFHRILWSRTFILIFISHKILWGFLSRRPQDPGSFVGAAWRGSRLTRPQFYSARRRAGSILDEHSVLRLTSGIPPLTSRTTWMMKSGTWTATIPSNTN
jgi:hypothetical protein